jgi:hypothetical protein
MSSRVDLFQVSFFPSWISYRVGSLSRLDLFQFISIPDFPGLYLPGLIASSVRSPPGYVVLFLAISH